MGLVFCVLCFGSLSPYVINGIYNSNLYQKANRDSVTVFVYTRFLVTVYQRVTHCTAGKALIGGSHGSSHNTTQPIHF